MSDDEKPITNLTVYRNERGPVRKPTRAKLADGKLLLSHDDGVSWIAFGDHEVKWLQSWIYHFRTQSHNATRVSEHRCRKCGFVTGIECRGHRDTERRTHYQVEVLERRRRWVSAGGAMEFERWLGDQASPVKDAVPEEYVSAAKSACGRRVSGSSTSSTWDEVDCATCLKRKPRSVP